MRDKIINLIMDSIKKHQDFSEEKLDEIKYGLEAFYIMLTKTVIILSIAYLLNIFLVVLLLALLHGLLRAVSFGLHAPTSFLCSVVSIILFLIPPMFFSYVFIPFPLELIISISALIIFILWAPADTKHRPLYNPKKRKRLKIISIVVVLLYTGTALLTDNNILSNAIFYALIIQSFNISPFAYKLFKFPYANYKTKEVKE